VNHFILFLLLPKRYSFGNSQVYLQYMAAILYLYYLDTGIKANGMHKSLSIMDACHRLSMSKSVWKNHLLSIGKDVFK